jgi:hypothetical protein
MRWVGALEVVRPSDDQRRIWSDEAFPVRFEVRTVILLDPELGVQMSELEGKVDFYTGPKDRGKFRAFVRISPNRFSNVKDAKLILSLLKQAQATPVARPVDPKKLARKPLLYTAERCKGKTTVHTVVIYLHRATPHPRLTCQAAPTRPSNRHTAASRLSGRFQC